MHIVDSCPSHLVMGRSSLTVVDEETIRPTQKVCSIQTANGIIEGSQTAEAYVKEHERRRDTGRGFANSVLRVAHATACSETHVPRVAVTKTDGTLVVGERDHAGGDSMHARVAPAFHRRSSGSSGVHRGRHSSNCEICKMTKTSRTSGNTKAEEGVDSLFLPKGIRRVDHGRSQNIESRERIKRSTSKCAHRSGSLLKLDST